MIFVTVGEQLPFDRLIRTIDEWKATSNEEVFAQIGKSQWKPLHMKYREFLSPQDFTEQFLTADIIIAHAGMGTIITAIEMSKPILVMPRQASKGEHRNDHQYATARRFMNRGIMVAMNEVELKHKLNCLNEIQSELKKQADLSKYTDLIKLIRGFAFGGL